MKKVRVEIPFYLNIAGRHLSAGDILVIDDDVVEKIRKVNINMVSVLEDAPEAEPESNPEAEPEKKPRARKK